jgi:hypothetical protein
MPGKDITSTSPKSTFYANPELEITMEDNNKGKIIVKMYGDPKEYVLHTKKFKNSKVQKYNGLLLFGKYPHVFYENNAMLSDIAKGIIGW